MNDLGYWKLTKHLSVVQAALLIIGQDPGEADKKDVQDLPRGYEAVKHALIQAILNKELPAKIKYTAREAWKDEIGCWVEEPEETETVGIKIRTGESESANYKSQYVFYNQEPDWTLTTITQNDIISWLEKNGLKPDFFFTNTSEAPDYLDSSNKCYSPKLAAAVQAWLHVTKNPQLLRNKNPKQAIIKWLNENAPQFGLSDEMGEPIRQSIEDIAKIANWNTKGGAPKTYGGE